MPKNGSMLPFCPQPLQSMQNSYSIAASDPCKCRQLADSKKEIIGCYTVFEGRGWKRLSNPLVLFDAVPSRSGQEGRESLSLC